MQIKLLELLLDQLQLKFDVVFYKHPSVNSHKTLLNLILFHDHTDGPLSFSFSPQVTAQTKVQM